MIQKIKNFGLTIFIKICIVTVTFLEFMNKYYKPNNINIQGLSVKFKEDLANIEYIS